MGASHIADRPDAGLAPAASGTDDGSEAGLSPQAGWLFIGLAVLALTTILPEVRSANDASRMAAVQAIVEHHTLVIEQTPFLRGEDKSWVNGHFYSDKPATPSLLAALVYAPLHALGLQLNYGVNVAYYLIVLAVSKTSWWGGALAFYKALRLIRLSEAGRLAATAALATGSLYLTFNAVFSNHGLAASWLAIGLYWYVRALRADAVRGPLAWCGLWVGLAAAADFPVAVYGAAIGALLLADGRLRKGLLGFCAAALAALVPGEAVNVAISGSLVPLTLVADFYLWPGSPWRREDLTGASRFTGLELVGYAVGCLVGPRGFLLYNPLVTPAIVSALRLAAGVRSGRPWAREAVAALGATAVLWAYYIASSTNFSGYSYSIRWFVPSLPVLLLFLAAGWAWRPASSRGPSGAAVGRTPRLPWWPPVFWTLFAFSALIALVGCLNPWSNIGVSAFPFTANLIEHWPELGRLLPR